MYRSTAMQSNRYRFFRWTPRTAGITFMYAVVVPGILGTLAYQVDVSFPFFSIPELRTCRRISKATARRSQADYARPGGGGGLVH